MQSSQIVISKPFSAVLKVPVFAYPPMHNFLDEIFPLLMNACLPFFLPLLIHLNIEKFHSEITFLHFLGAAWQYSDKLSLPFPDCFLFYFGSTVGGAWELFVPELIQGLSGTHMMLEIKPGPFEGREIMQSVGLLSCTHSRASRAPNIPYGLLSTRETGVTPKHLLIWSSPKKTQPNLSFPHIKDALSSLSALSDHPHF